MLSLVFLLAIAAPSNFKAISNSPTSVSLGWQYSGGNINNFQLERQQAGSFSQIATLGVNSRSYADNSLTPNTQYTYRIRAHKGNQYSQYVYVVITTQPVIIPPPIPDPPPGPACGAIQVGLTKIFAFTNSVNPVQSVTFYANSTVLSVMTQEPFVYLLDPTKLLTGCYDLHAIVLDSLNQTGISNSFTIEVHN